MTEEQTTQTTDETAPDAAPPAADTAETEEFEFAFPRWFRLTLYVAFAIFIAVSVVIITRSMIQQHRLRTALAVLEARHGVADEQQILQARQDMAQQPVHSFQYLLQSLLQDLDTDPRMAIVLVLDKAIGWGETTRQRDLVGQLVAAFHDDGALRDDFVLTDETKARLGELIVERRAAADASYAETRITEVLEWMHAGCPTEAHATELRRLRVLARGYDKKRFTSKEASVLRTLADGDSLLGPDALKSVAPKFSDMLDGKTVVLTDEEAADCLAQRDELQSRYAGGMIKVAETVALIARQIAEGDVFVDHPHIYQCVSLLGYRHDPRSPELHKGVRDEIARAVVALQRHNRFVITHLAEFASRTAINPVMAVETERLTASEHARQMNWVNEERLRRCIAQLHDAFADYLQNADEFHFKGPIRSDAERDAFIRRTVVGTLRALAEDRTVGDAATAALEGMKTMEGATPFFE
jgi:hypothetical protein